MNPRSAFQADITIHRLSIRVSGVDPPEVLADTHMPGSFHVRPTTPLLARALVRGSSEVASDNGLGPWMTRSCLRHAPGHRRGTDSRHQADLGGHGRTPGHAI